MGVHRITQDMHWLESVSCSKGSWCLERVHITIYRRKMGARVSAITELACKDIH